MRKMYMSREGNNKLISMLLATGTFKDYLTSTGYSKKEMEEDPYNLDNEVNYDQKMKIFNEFYEDTHNQNMLKQLYEGLYSLLEGNKSEIFICLNLISAQLKIEDEQKNSFTLDNINLLKKIEEILEKRGEELRQDIVISMMHDYEGTIEKYGEIVSGRLKR